MDSRRTKVNLNVSTKSEACVNRGTEGSTLSEKQHVQDYLRPETLKCRARGRNHMHSG
jgi:hypothetical protein